MNIKPIWERQHTALAALLLTIITLFTYHDAIDNGFHFDDLENITSQAAIRLDTLTLTGLYDAATESLLIRRPIPNMTFALDWWRGHGDPAAFQQTNLLIHTTNAILVFLLLIILGRKFAPEQKNLTWLAMICATLWAVHPIQIQGVTYIVQRMASMATLFTLLTIITYIKGRAGNKSHLWFTLSLTAFIIAALCKESAWITPLLILLIEYGLIRHNQPLVQHKRDYLILSLPLIPLAYILIDFASGQGALSKYVVTGFSIRDFTLGERLLTQPRVILSYLSQFFWPMPDRFSIEHDFTISTGLLTPISTLTALFSVIGWCATGLYLFTKQKLRLWGVTMLWLPLCLLIESSIIPLEIIYEHRFYLPSISLVALLLLIMISFQKLIKPMVFIALCFTLLCIYSSLQRIPVWKDTLSLYESALSHAPNSARLWSNLSALYARAGDYEKAQNAVQTTLQLDKDSPLGLEVYGVILMDQGDYREAERKFITALSKKRPESSLLNHLGELYLKLENYHEAKKYFSQAIEMKPWVSAYHWNIALTLEGLLECNAAYQHWQQFSKLDDNPEDLKSVEEHIASNYKTPTGKCFNPAL